MVAEEHLFKCPICSILSSRRDNMLRHLSTMHPESNRTELIEHIVASSTENHEQTTPRQPRRRPRPIAESSDDTESNENQPRHSRPKRRRSRSNHRTSTTSQPTVNDTVPHGSSSHTSRTVSSNIAANLPTINIQEASDEEMPSPLYHYIRKPVKFEEIHHLSPSLPMDLSTREKRKRGLLGWKGTVIRFAGNEGVQQNSQDESESRAFAENIALVNDPQQDYDSNDSITEEISTNNAIFKSLAASDPLNVSTSSPSESLEHDQSSGVSDIEFAPISSSCPAPLLQDEEQPDSHTFDVEHPLEAIVDVPSAPNPPGAFLIPSRTDLTVTVTTLPDQITSSTHTIPLEVTMQRLRSLVSSPPSPPVRISQTSPQFRPPIERPAPYTIHHHRRGISFNTERQNGAQINRQHEVSRLQWTPFLPPRNLPEGTTLSMVRPRRRNKPRPRFNLDLSVSRVSSTVDLSPEPSGFQSTVLNYSSEANSREDPLPGSSGFQFIIRNSLSEASQRDEPQPGPSGFHATQREEPQPGPSGFQPTVRVSLTEAMQRNEPQAMRREEQQPGPSGFQPQRVYLREALQREEPQPGPSGLQASVRTSSSETRQNVSSELPPNIQEVNSIHSTQLSPEEQLQPFRLDPLDFTMPSSRQSHYQHYQPTEAHLEHYRTMLFGNHPLGNETYSPSLSSNQMHPFGNDNNDSTNSPHELKLTDNHKLLPIYDALESFRFEMRIRNEQEQPQALVSNVRSELPNQSQEQASNDKSEQFNDDEDAETESETETSRPKYQGKEPSPPPSPSSNSNNQPPGGSNSLAENNSQSQNTKNSSLQKNQSDNASDNLPLHEQTFCSSEKNMSPSKGRQENPLQPQPMQNHIIEPLTNCARNAHDKDHGVIPISLAQYLATLSPPPKDSLIQTIEPTQKYRSIGNKTVSKKQRVLNYNKVTTPSDNDCQTLEDTSLHRPDDLNAQEGIPQQKLQVTLLEDAKFPRMDHQVIHTYQHSFPQKYHVEVNVPHCSIKPLAQDTLHQVSEKSINSHLMSSSNAYNYQSNSAPQFTLNQMLRNEDNHFVNHQHQTQVQFQQQCQPCVRITPQPSQVWYYGNNMMPQYFGQQIQSEEPNTFGANRINYTGYEQHHQQTHHHQQPQPHQHSNQQADTLQSSVPLHYDLRHEPFEGEQTHQEMYEKEHFYAPFQTTEEEMRNQNIQVLQLNYGCNYNDNTLIEQHGHEPEILSAPFNKQEHFPVGAANYQYIDAANLKHLAPPNTPAGRQSPQYAPLTPFTRPPPNSPFYIENQQQYQSQYSRRSQIKSLRTHIIFDKSKESISENSSNQHSNRNENKTTELDNKLTTSSLSHQSNGNGTEVISNRQHSQHKSQQSQNLVKQQKQLQEQPNPPNQQLQQKQNKNSRLTKNTNQSISNQNQGQYRPESRPSRRKRKQHQSKTSQQEKHSTGAATQLDHNANQMPSSNDIHTRCPATIC